MKKLLVLININLWLVFFCCSISAQNFKTIDDGIEHAEMKRGTESEPIKINLLRLDLTKVRLDVVHAMDAAIGLETTSSMATRHGASAAINAGFFRLDKSIFAGDAAGVLMIDGKLLSESYSDRVALMINNSGRNSNVFINRLNYSETLSFNGQPLEITGINRERGDNDLILYTPEFHLSTLTKAGGVEIEVQKSEVIGLTGNCAARDIPGIGKIPIYFGGANKKIPQNGFVLSASGTHSKLLTDALNPDVPLACNQKMRVTVNQRMDFPDLKNEDKNLFSKLYTNSSVSGHGSFASRFIVGGVPQLVKNGKIEITWEQEKQSKSFVETRHPRTAVAKLKDGKFLMVAVDGRQKESVGMNLNELAALLLELGAVDAMNLDGGGSTTMFAGGKVVNQPSDQTGERKVGDAILVFPRKRN